MPINRNAIIRYRALDRCFSNRLVRYDIGKLIEAVSIALKDFELGEKPISRAQIYADISFMKSTQGFNIELDEDFKDGRNRYYRYLDPSFSINNIPLNDAETSQLVSAIDTLSQFKGLPQFEWVQELIPKLEQGIFIKNKKGAIIEFDNNIYLKGLDHIGVLYNAISYKRVLRIKYFPFEYASPVDIILHPYYLKQYNNRWFLLGYNGEYDRYDWNLALDRIVGIEEIDCQYNENNAIVWDEYFQDFIGVTKEMGKEPIDLLLHFYGVAGKYVESKPIHGSQKAKWINKDVLEVRLNLMVNYELESFILSYADKVKVISPIDYSEYIKGRLLKAIENY